MESDYYSRVRVSSSRAATQRRLTSAIVRILARQHFELPGMYSGEQDQRASRADKAHQRVPLRIPNVALSAQELVGALSQHHSGRELDQFVKRADREAAGENEDGQELASRHTTKAEQKLADHDRQYEALHEMPKPVVGIAREAEPILDGDPDRHPGIAVRAAKHKDEAMGADEKQGERRQRPPRLRYQEKWKRNHDRR